MGAHAEYRRRGTRDRGAVAIVVALSLVLLMGFLALVVDVGNLFRVRGELQNAADAAALAGAQALDGGPVGIEAARGRVEEYARMHFADRGEVEVLPDDIRFGHWHAHPNDFCQPAPCFQSFGSAPTGDQARSANAIQVATRRSDVNASPVALFFAPFIGHSEASVSTSAIAVGGGPEKECAFPMVLPDCVLEGSVSGSSGATCDYCMKMQDNNTDNAAWTTFSEHGQVSGTAIANVIKQVCYSNPSDPASPIALDADGACDGQCVGADTGEPIQVGNGNGMNTGKNNFCPVIQRILQRGVPGGPAQPFSVKVPVIRTGMSGDACAPQFSGAPIVAGYATLVIYGARCSNGGQEVRVADLPSDCASRPDWPPPSGKYIIAALRCDLASTSIAGGGFFGTDALRVRLVQ
jgi:hypothetical protein